MIEYDQKKNERNIRLRGLDFNLIYDFEWGWAVIEEDKRKDYGEKRYIATSYLGSRLHHVSYTLRNDVVRVISFRKANKREEKNYEEKTRLRIH